jgi:hypothetical protein|tara:strand:+ start:290 stop:664 length:375 start_codon:yes stop_codon:yes gene_type:complete
MKTHTGKVYVITNTDYPDQFYVGSTGQDYLTKRYYCHKQEHQSGSKSYGNLFDTKNHSIDTIFAKVDLRDEELRMKERFYYDKYKADGKTITNQRFPWRTPEEAKVVAQIYYLTKVKVKNTPPN